MKRKLNRRETFCIYFSIDYNEVQWYQNKLGWYSGEYWEYFIGKQLTELPIDDRDGWIEIKDDIINNNGWKLWERIIE